MTVRVVDVSGDHGEIGYQHAVAVLDLREQIGAMVERQVRQARPRLAEQADRRLGALQAVLERHSPATLA
ncbi:hypothetical protein, partial [Sphaerobacter sp.]|uniref:hypothetical protein n=1 Tax=Sphaerobacter sp. TaxID=2099654 RepID=UPI001D3F39BD